MNPFPTLQTLVEFVSRSDARSITISNFDSDWCVIVKVGVMVFHASGDVLETACAIVVKDLTTACLMLPSESAFAA